MDRVLFSSQSCEWQTPIWLFRELDKEFGFTLDVCASSENALVEVFIDSNEIVSSLQKDWEGVCWMNPPYGKTIHQWMQKAYESAQKGATVVCLVPSRTDTLWWHEWAMRASEIRFIRGRLKFGNSEFNAPFPSAIVIFKSEGTI